MLGRLRVRLEALHQLADPRVLAVDARDLHGADEWRVDAAGANEAHADAVAPQVKAQHLGDTP